MLAFWVPFLISRTKAKKEAVSHLGTDFVGNSRGLEGHVYLEGYPVEAIGDDGEQ